MRPRQFEVRGGAWVRLGWWARPGAAGGRLFIFKSKPTYSQVSEPEMNIDFWCSYLCSYILICDVFLLCLLSFFGLMCACVFFCFLFFCCSFWCSYACSYFLICVCLFLGLLSFFCCSRYFGIGVICLCFPGVCLLNVFSNLCCFVCFTF